MAKDLNVTINFDMDGTIADLYGVENWLPDLRAENTRPYAEAKPLVNMSVLARTLNRLIENGNEVNIISWTSKGGSADYNERVAETKRKWLNKHLRSVKFSNIFIVPYGTPKETVASGILFDDEEHNRTNWGKNAYTEKEIFKVLTSIR